MGIDDFSSASQWEPLAKEAHRQRQELDKGGRKKKKKRGVQRQAGEEEGRGWGVVGSLRHLITW
jgi:hypothetical protein